MNNRVSNIVSIHLKEKYAQTEQILSEAVLKKTILDSLNSNYSSFFENKLRQDDIKTLVKKLYLLVSQFSQTDIPEKMLDSELQSYKNKFLDIISQIALAQKNSILDSIYDYFKKNPTSDTLEVEEYVKSFLKNVIIDIDRYVVKWKDI
jgi:hypothetical protein